MTPPPMMTTRARAGSAVLTRPTYPPRARLGSPSPVERRQHAGGEAGGFSRSTQRCGFTVLRRGLRLGCATRGFCVVGR